MMGYLREIDVSLEPHYLGRDEGTSLEYAFHKMIAFSQSPK